MHLHSNAFALGATCSYFSLVPGRLHRALSYSGTGKSCHDRMGDHRARSRDRFTLKAIVKGGTFIGERRKEALKKAKSSVKKRYINMATNSFASYFGNITTGLK